MTPGSNDTQSAAKIYQNRLRRLVISLFGVAFLLVASFVAAGLWLRYDEVIRDAHRDAENLTTILAGDLQLRIDSIEETLRELASFSRFIGGPGESGQEWMTLLRTAAAGRTGFEAVMVTDASGRATFSSLPILMGESWAESKVFHTLSQDPSNDALIADEPQRSSNDSRIVVPLARVIRTPRTEFEGLAIANLAPEQLRDFYRTVDVGENGIVWLLLPPDNVLLREPPGEGPQGGSWPPVLAGTLQPGGSGAASGPATNGGPPYITAYSSLPGTGLTVAVSFAETDVLGPWWNEVYASVALTLLVGLVMLVVAIAVIRASRREEPLSNDPAT